LGNLDGKVAFITGIARGQGRAHALKLAKEGASIIGVDICRQIDTVPYPLATPDDLRNTVREIEALGGKVLASEGDVRDIETLRTIIDDGHALFGRLDIVIANAGIGGYSRNGAAVRKNVIEVNQTGVYNTIEVSKRYIIEGGRGGSVVVVSSLAGTKALDAGPGYSESKHGIVGLMRLYAHEFAPHMIRCNSVHPTTVLTPFVQNDYFARTLRPDLDQPTWEDMAAPFAELNLMPIPWVEAEDVANAVMFLVSDESRYITGISLPVDAGAAIK
jgi:SDR family mycofactocin-dependent oxidoreductase